MSGVLLPLRTFGFGKGYSFSQEDQREEMNDDNDSIFVSMNEYGLTSGNSRYHRIKTIGVGPCVSVVLYDSRIKLAGLLHAHIPLGGGWEPVHNIILPLVYAMNRNGMHQDHHEIETHVIGGYDHDLAASAVKERMHQSFGFTNIVSDVRSLQGDGQSIIVNASTGKVYDLVNILPKAISELELLQMRHRSMTGAVVLTQDQRSLD